VADSLAHAQYLADSIARVQFVADSLDHVAWVLDSIRIADSLGREAQAQRELDRLRFLTDSLEKAQQMPKAPPTQENSLPPQQDPTETPDQPQSGRQKRWGPDDATPKRPTALAQIEPEKGDEEVLPPPTESVGLEGNPELGNEFTQYVVRFDSGSSRIPEEARVALRKMADQLTAQPETQAALFVIGDDEMGSQIRTSAVKYYFIGAGAPEQRVNVLEHTIPENPPAIQFRYTDEVLILVRLLQR
jgi:outer membrane protein OmpA-like peptidoglycan-associated protein